MKPKFEVGQLVRLGGVKPRALPYEWVRRGRVVRVKAVVKADWLGRRHLGYVIQGRRGKPNLVLASYELREVSQRSKAGRPGKSRAST